MKSYKGYNQVFRPSFHSPTTLARDGGSVTGTPTINGRLVFTATDTQRVNWKDTAGLRGATKASFRVKFKAPADVSGVSYIFGNYNYPTTLQFLVQISNGVCNVFVNSGASDTCHFNISASEEIELLVAWDSTLGTAALRCPVYKNGAAFTPTYTAVSAIPMIDNSRADWVSGGFLTTSQCGSGAIVEIAEVYKGVQLSAEEVKDLFEQDTVQELEQPLIDLPLRSWYYNGSSVAVTDNKGTLGGTVKLGDGTTTTTFPTQLTPHGMSFDGGDYIDFDQPVITNTNQAWTLATLLDLQPVDGTADEIISNYTSAIAPSIIVQRHGTSGFVVYVFSSTGNLKASTFTYLVNTNFKGTLIVSNDGSLASGGINLYLNGIKQTVTSASMTGTLAAAAITAKLKIGKDIDNTNYLSASSKVNTLKIYNRELTPTQARIESDKMMKFLNV